MGGRGGSMGGSHGMSGGGAAKAATSAAPQTREQQLLAQIKGNPAALMQMSDQEALDTIKAVAAQPIATDRTQNDTFCQRWLNTTGLANEMPEVLDDTAFGKARRKANAVKLYHSDTPYDGNAATAVRTLNQLQTGKTAYASFGVHGGGTYLDTDATANALCYAGTNGSQVKMFLNSHAKIANRNDLKRAQTDFQRKHPSTYSYLTNQLSSTQWGSNELKTIWLTCAGYNAYDGGGYRVAYSRKALTICKTIKRRAQITHNW